MHHAAPLFLLLLVALAIPPSAVAAQLDYAVYVIGLPVGVATLGLDRASSSYRMVLRFHTTGLADMFAGDSLDQRTTGRFEHEQPAPLEYASSGRLNGQDRIVAMTWSESTPSITSITPPNTTEREEVPQALLAHAMDPLDAIVLLMHQVERTGRCEETVRAYDGRRLQLLEARTVGEDDIEQNSRSNYYGHALRCEFSDRTLAGYRLGKGRDDDMRMHRGTIWLAPVLPGALKVPVRAAVETRLLGDAMIYLTSASP